MKLTLQKIVLASLAVFGMVFFGANSLVLSDAQELQDRTDELSTSVAGATATHDVGFEMTDDTDELGSVEIQFCSNDPLADFPCTAPTSFDDSAAVLTNQSGNTGFTINAASTGNELILSRTPAIPTTTGNSYEFNGIINPAAAGALYVRLYTFPTDDATGPESQHGGIALYINNNFTVSAEVPPYLKFCVGTTIIGFDCSTATDFFIDMGDFNTTRASTSSSEFVAATNAQSGYSVTVSGTTLTSGNNIIQSLPNPKASLPGTSQFGMNLRANNAPPVGLDPIGPGAAIVTADYDAPNLFTYNNGDILVSAPTASDNQNFTVSYITNVSPSQAAGVYTTTISYICLANF